jgi:uncharacterized protein
MARYPHPAPIEAYGNGGFRFAGMSHRGSILCLPSGIFDWSATDVSRLTPEDFNAVFSQREALSFLLLGCGRRTAFPPSDVGAAFASAGLGLEPMDTGAACRTYNVLLAEGRRVAAALIAVA